MTAFGRSLVPGAAEGPVLRLDEPISFWGGVETASGLIIEDRHPQVDRSVTGTILVLPYGRGSSSSPSVLAEMIRLGTAPAGVILTQPDPMVVVASLVASDLYAITLPVLVLDDARLRTGERAEIRLDGEVRFTSPGG